MDVAQLGLKIDGIDNVDQATRSLGGLAGAADRAEASTGTLGTESGKAKRQIDDVGKSSSGAASRMGELGQVATRVGGLLAAAFSVRALQQYADGWSDMQSQVGAATGDMAGAADQMRRLTDIANASYSPLQQTVEAYARNVQVLSELGLSASQAADFTESLNNMLVLTATRGQRAASVQDALSKAMATGRLQADGLETVLANGGEVAAALARELDTNVSSLRGLATEGKITGAVIANAIGGSLEDVRARAALMPATIGDAFTRINTNITEFVGRIDQATGTSAAIAGAILSFADGIRTAGDFMIRLGELAAPAFNLIGNALAPLAPLAEVALAAVAGFASPVLIAGVGTLAGVIGGALVTAIRSATAAMLANPVGLVIGAITAAVYALYTFRDSISEVLGVDLVDIAKRGANLLIGSFVAAYEDIKFVWNNFGDIMGGAVIGGVNIAIRAINGLIQGALSGVNTLVEAINKIPGIDVGRIGSSVGISELANPYADRLAGAAAARNAAVRAAREADYLGDLSKAFEKTSGSAEKATDKIKKFTAGQSGVAGPTGAATAAIADQGDAIGGLIAQIDAADAAWLHHTASIDDQITATNAQRLALEAQASTYGMAASQVVRMEAAQTRDAISKLESARATAILNGESGLLIGRYDEEIEKLGILYDSRQQLAGVMGEDESRKAFDEMRDQGQRASEDIGKSLTDALMRGFESGDGFAKNLVDTTRNLFNTLVLRPIIQPVAQSAANAVTGALGLGGSGGGGWLGSAIKEGAYTVGESLSKMGGAIGKVGNVIFDNAQLISKAVPWIGVGMTALSFLGEAFKGETRTGAQYGLAVNDQLYNPRRGTTVGSANGVQFLEGPSGGGSSGAVQKAIQATVDGVNGLFKTIGTDISLAAFWAGFEGSEKGRGGVGAGGALSTGAIFGEQGTGDNYRGTLFDPSRPNSLSAEDALNMLPAQLAQASLQAWQSASEQMPPMFDRMLQGIDLAGLPDEKLIELRDAFVAAVVATEELRIGLSLLPFAPAAAQTFRFASALIDFVGSADEAAGLLSNAYQNYWTDAQRLEDTTARVTQGFADINRELPTSRQMMQDWIVEAMAMGEAGAQTTAALLNLGDGLDIILSASEATAEALREEAKARDESRETERLSLENKILALEGDTVELRRRELGALDPANQALQTYIWLLEDQKAATDAAAASLKATHDEIDNLAEGYNDIIDPSGRAARNQQALQASFQGLNLVMPETRADFHNLLESFRQAGPEFDDVYLAMLRMAPAFADYVGGLEDSRKALEDSAAAFSQMQADAKFNIAQTIDGLRESVVLDQLATPDRQYAYYESQINALMDLMPSLTSVDAIESTAQKITQLAGSAYGLLDQSGRQTVGEDLLRFLDQLEQTSGQAIDKQREQADKRSAEIMAGELDRVGTEVVHKLETVVRSNEEANRISNDALRRLTQATLDRLARTTQGRGREVTG